MSSNGCARRSCDEYGYSAWKKERLRGLVELLVYAKSEHEYTKHRAYTKQLLRIGPYSGALVGETRDCRSARFQCQSVTRRTGLHASVGNVTDCDSADVPFPVGSATNPSASSFNSFDVYFTKNWDSCRDQWCAYTRQSAVNLGNNTNNRLELSWKQLKEVVNSFTSVDEFIASIMYYQSLVEKKSSCVRTSWWLCRTHVRQ